MLKSYTQLYLEGLDIYLAQNQFWDNNTRKQFRQYLDTLKKHMDQRKSITEFFEKESREELTSILKFNNVFNELLSKLEEFKNHVYQLDFNRIR